MRKGIYVSVGTGMCKQDWRVETELELGQELTKHVRRNRNGRYKRIWNVNRNGKLKQNWNKEKIKR